MEPIVATIARSGCAPADQQDAADRQASEELRNGHDAMPHADADPSSLADDLPDDLRPYDALLRKAARLEPDPTDGLLHNTLERCFAQSASPMRGIASASRFDAPRPPGML
jgi:hypothetical protein